MIINHSSYEAIDNMGGMFVYDFNSTVSEMKNLVEEISNSLKTYDVVTSSVPEDIWSNIYLTEDDNNEPCLFLVNKSDVDEHKFVNWYCNNFLNHRVVRHF